MYPSLPARPTEECGLQLIACQNCHTQYDISEIAAETFPCRCGNTLENRPPRAVDAAVERCGACGAHVTSDAESCAYCSSIIVREPRDLSLICPECFARSADDARFCTACGVGFRPEKVDASGPELACPACEILMPSQQIAGIALNECTKCRGLWVPGKSFDALIERATEARRSAAATLQVSAPRVTGDNPAAQKVQYRKCPGCEVHMNRRNFRKSSGIIIDVCRDCGTWLDADELEGIAGFILSGSQTSSVFSETKTVHSSHSELRAKAEATRILAENGMLSNARERYETRTENTRAGGDIVSTVLDIFVTLLK